MDPWSLHNYNQAAKTKGIARKVIKAASDQARSVQEKGLPPILTLNHLAFHTDTPYLTLRKIVNREIDPYRAFQISKRAGGHRTICAPIPALLRVQRWLSKFVLSSVTPHEASFAYHPDSSQLACAKM